MPENKFMSLKQEIEVILFWKSQALSINQISNLLNSNPKEIKNTLMDLVREYELRDSGLQINFKDNGYILEPREEFNYLAENLLPVNLKLSILRTLALIALKEPVKQNLIIQVRGSAAYEHIKELMDKGWLTKEPVGATFILKTTNDFRKYFKLSESGDELKEKLQKIIEEAEKAQEETTSELTDNLNIFENINELNDNSESSN